MNELTVLREAGPEAPALSAAARATARAALLDEIAGCRTARRRSRPRLPSRAVAVRVGAVVVAAAAAWTAAVVVPHGSGSGPSGAAHRSGGLALVATQEITFPVSLAPVPAGMTPLFTGDRTGGDAIADYRTAEGETGPGFTIEVSTAEPRSREDEYATYRITGTGTVDVGGSSARYTSGIEADTCFSATGCVHGRSFTDLLWQRPGSGWVRLRGEDDYGDLAAVVGLAGSLVDRPQPVPLQVRLAPAGWSVESWHNSGDVELTDDRDPRQHLLVQAFTADSGWTADHLLDPVTVVGEVLRLTVHDRPAQLVRAHDPYDQNLRFWYLAGQFADGTLFTVHAPETFARDDVLAIARQVTYLP